MRCRARNVHPPIFERWAGPGRRDRFRCRSRTENIPTMNNTRVAEEVSMRAPQYSLARICCTTPRTFMMAGSLTVPSPRTASHSSALPRLPLPRTTGTPLSVAISRARILSPKRARTWGDGPTHPTPESARDLAKGADSERKPYPALFFHFRFSGKRHDAHIIRYACRVLVIEHSTNEMHFLYSIFKMLVSDNSIIHTIYISSRPTTRGKVKGRYMRTATTLTCTSHSPGWT